MSTPTSDAQSKPNIVIRIAEKLEIAAEDALAFVRKGQQIGPAVAGALGVLASATEKALTDVDTAAKTPTQILNIQFDTQTLMDMKAVWPELKAFLQTLGIKF